MSKTFHFEQSISELEAIVNQLEQGELSLDDALKQFEKGISLARKCQEVLNQAEQKIEYLSKQQTTQEDNTDE